MKNCKYRLARLLNSMATKVLLASVIVCLSVTNNVQAKEEYLEDDDVTWVNVMGGIQGKGTRTDPYLISSAGQLDLVRNDLSGTYMLVEDIDMCGEGSWNPIGDGSNPFTGAFYGSGHKISNLLVDGYGLHYAGLFGRCADAVIDGIVLENASIQNDTSGIDFTGTPFEDTLHGTTSIFVGGIVGANTGSNARIENCQVGGSIAAINCNDAFVGGIVGYGTFVSSCLNSADVFVESNRDSRSSNDGEVRCGGIVGESTAVNAAIWSCENQGSVTASAGDYVSCGGISGRYGSIWGCKNKGSVSGTISHTNNTYSSFAENCNVGGIVGDTCSESTCYSINYGRVYGRANCGGTCAVGGIAGFLGYDRSGWLTGCINCAPTIESIRQKKEDGDWKDFYSDAARIVGKISNCKGVDGSISIDSSLVNGALVLSDSNSDDKNGLSLNSDELDSRIERVLSIRNLRDADISWDGIDIKGMIVEASHDGIKVEGDAATLQKSKFDITIRNEEGDERIDSSYISYSLEKVDSGDGWVLRVYGPSSGRSNNKDCVYGVASEYIAIRSEDTSGYIPSVDGWGFANIGTSIWVSGPRFSVTQGPSSLSKELFYSVFQDGVNSEQVYKEKKEAGEDGLCHGLSLVSVMSYTGVCPFEEWTWQTLGVEEDCDYIDDYLSLKEDFEKAHGSGRLSGIPQKAARHVYCKSIGRSLEDYVQMAHTVQWLPWVQKSCKANEVQGSGDASGILTMIRSSIANRKPVMLRVIGANVSGHALVPYKIQDMGSGECRVYVYDSLRPMNDEIFISFTENTSGKVHWELSGVLYTISQGEMPYTIGSNDKNSKISVESYATLLMEWQIIKGGPRALEDVESVMDFLKVTSGYARVKEKATESSVSWNGDVWECNGSERVVHIEEANGDSEDVMSQSELFWVARDDSYEITTLGSDSPCSAMYATDFAAVTLGAEASATFCLSRTDGGLEASASPITEAKVTLSYEDSAGNSIIVKGTAPGIVHLLAEEASVNKITVLGFSGQVTVMRYVENESTIQPIENLDSNSIVSIKADSEGCSLSITIADKAEQVVSASDVRIGVGETVGLAATSSGDGELSFKSSNSSIASVDSSGFVRGVSAGTAQIIITASETYTYRSATKSVTVTVGIDEFQALCYGVDNVRLDASMINPSSDFYAYPASDDGEACLGGYHGDSSVVVVPSVIDGQKIVGLESGCFEGDTAIREVYLPDTVTDIVELAFRGCTSLESVNLGSIKKDLSRRRFNGILRGCTSLKRLTMSDEASFPITLNDGTGNYLNIMDDAVVNSLEYIYLGSSMGDTAINLFYGDSLKRVDVGEGNRQYSSVGGVVYSADGKVLQVMGSAYEGEYKIPDGCVEIGSFAFQNCDGLTNVYIPASVTKIGSFSFDDSSPTITTPRGSYASEYAKEKGLRVVYTDGPLKEQVITAKDVSVAVGEAASIGASTSGDGKLSYKSADTGIATVDALGRVRGFSVGTTKVTVIASETETYESATRSVTVKVTAATSTGAKWSRLAGNGRYDTMAAIVQEGFTKSEWAVVATGKEFPDALVAASLAGAKGCPVVLTAPGSLSKQARGELERLGVKRAYVMGGTGAVDGKVVSAIEGMGITAERVEGSSRMGTSLETLKEISGLGRFDGTVVVATGYNFADALSIGPWCFRTATPMLLTNKSGRLSDAQASYCRGRVKRVIIVGGEAAVSDEVVSQLGLTASDAKRLAGPNRFATSKMIAEWECGEQGMTMSNVAVATGDNFPDALAGAALCGTKASLLLLVRNERSATLQLVTKDAGIKTGYVLGGEGAVSASLMSKLESLTK